MLPIRSSILVAVLGLVPVMDSPAQDRVRLTLDVTKKTVVQPTYKSAAGDEQGRIQALGVVVKNSGIRPVPEGEVSWTVLVRKGALGIYKYSGRAALPALLSFKSTELQFGAFPVDVRNNGITVERDKLEYDIAIFHGGKETHRSTSISNFAAMAAAAQSMSEEPKAAIAASVPATTSPPAPVPATPAPAAMPAPAPMPAPAQPPVTPATAPPVPQQPFDFFNLNGRKPPVTK